uniref:Bulb-type lectin domain-containing protein n=1 Tax=Nelumbo nucifera TaxID=4432 RepID=A0A822Y2Q9_NELNU|nr:TPA_asm: hypothetical protein HUJ06_027721 [Nelumbo nucifera]
MELKDLPLLMFCYNLLCFLSNISLEVDTVALNQTITGDQTLVSAGDTYELGFFGPGNSRNRYLGIWYKNIPLPTIIGDDGNLVLLNKAGSIVWSSISSRAAKISISGDDSESYLWQSFDYSSDTFDEGGFGPPMIL